MLDNRMRRELLTKARQSGFPGSILDVYSAYEQGKDLIAEYEQQQKVQQTQQMSDLAAQQSGMMQQAPSMPEQQLPQMPSFPPSVKANIPQAPESTTQNLVSSEQSQPVGMSTSKQGPRGGQLLLAKGGFKGDPEKPKKKNILYVESKNDPNYTAYADSLHLYNQSMKPRLTGKKSFGEYGSHGLRGRSVTDVPLPEGYTVPGPIQPIGQRITRGYYPEYVIAMAPYKPGGKDYRKSIHNIYKEPTREVVVGEAPLEFLEPKGLEAPKQKIDLVKVTKDYKDSLPISNSYGVTDLGGNIGMIRKDNGVVGYVPLDKFFGTQKQLGNFYNDPKKSTREGYNLSRSDFDEWSSNVPIRGNVGDVQWDIYEDNEREYRNRTYKSKMAKGGFEKKPAKPDPTKPRGRKSDYRYKIIEGKYVFTLPDGRTYTYDNKDLADATSKFLKSGKWGWINGDQGYAFGRIWSDPDPEPKAPMVLKKEKPDNPDFTYQITPTYGNMGSLIYNPRVYTSDYNIDTEWGNRSGSNLMYTEPYQEKQFYKNQISPDYENISLKPRAKGNYAYSIIINGEEYLVDHPYEGPHKGYGYVNIPNRGEFEIDYRSGKPELKKSPTRLNKGGFEECYTCNRNKLKRYSK